MDAPELLMEWPGWANANAERVLASPAWCMSVDHDGIPAEVTVTSDVTPDLLWLDVTFDDERHQLGVADSETMPELHLLWEKRRSLPTEILLALAERECGALFQMLENASGKMFALKGVSDVAEPKSAKVRAFAVRKRGTGDALCAFALDMTPALTLAFGQLRHLDTNHPSIREMTIDAVAEYVRFEISDDEVGRLAAGDFLLCGDLPSAKWRYGSKPVLGLRAIDARPGLLTFGQIADDALPPVPEPGALVLVRDGERLAEGVFDRVAETVAVRIVKLVNKG